MAIRCFLPILLSAFLAVSASADAKLGPRQVSELVEIARTEDEPEGRRARAIRELAHTDVKTHLPLLRRLLREERSLDIRLSAACTLAALGDSKAPKDLLLASAYDAARTPNCSRCDVLAALGRLGDPAAEFHLERAVREMPPADEPQFYPEACRALAALGTEGATRILLSALRQGAPALRHAAISPLTELALRPGSAVREPVRTALLGAARADAEERVAEQAASALFWGGVDPPAAFALLENDPEPPVRARMARVLDRHYLGAARRRRLEAALSAERDGAVRNAIEATLKRQQPVR